MILYSVDTSEPVQISDHLWRDLTFHSLQLKANPKQVLSIAFSKSTALLKAKELGATWVAVLRPGQVIGSDRFFSRVSEAISQLSGSEGGIILRFRGVDLQIVSAKLDLQNQSGFPTIDYEETNLLDLKPKERTPEFARIVRQLHLRLPDLNFDETTNQALQFLHYQSRGYGSEMFIFNTEPYTAVTDSRKLTSIDSFSGVASGFKDMYLLHHHGFRENTKLNYFDVCPLTLRLKEYLLSQWEGLNFIDTFRNFSDKHTEEIRALIHPVDLQALEHEWDIELNNWGGPESFAHAFRSLKQLPRSFQCTDIVMNADDVLDRIADRPGARDVLWLSNCFCFTPSLAHYNWNLNLFTTQAEALEKKIQQLATNQNRQILVYGRLPNIQTPTGSNARLFSPITSTIQGCRV